MSLVHLKNKKNGVTYVYESVGHWDKEKHQSRSERVCVGKLDPITGEIVPNRARAGAIPRTALPGPVPTMEFERRFYGATYLFDAIGAKLGITTDLKKCFPEIHGQILSIAYYLILEDRNPLSRFPRWARNHVHPYRENIPSQRSSELFAMIEEDAKQNFFVHQAGRRLETEFLAYDTTSISSYSKLLNQARYGHNKEHDPLAQINLALLFGETSQLPFYYRKLPGNIPDVKTIQNLLADIAFLKLDKVQLVMDRGFYSEVNINALYHKHYKFLISVKTSLKYVKKNLDEVRGSMVLRPHYSSRYEIYYESRMLDWQYCETKKRSKEVVKDTRRLYLHLYYNDQKATDDRVSFNKLLDGLEEELTSRKRNPDHEKLYEKYYEVNDTPVRGVSLVAKQQAIVEAEKDYGYFAMISNGIKDPLEALEIYRTKDLIEKAFGNLKERLSMRRTSVWSEENLDGKLFVQFVALIYLSYIKKAMSDHDLFKDYTMQELLDEFDLIERFEQPGRKHRIGEMTEKQEKLYSYFDVAPPTLV
jgi:transposase